MEFARVYTSKINLQVNKNLPLYPNNLIHDDGDSGRDWN
jgi:hypothetical protein